MDTVRRCYVRGLLAGYEEGFRAELVSLGYTTSSIEYKINEVSLLSRWLGDRGLSLSDLDEGRLGEFVGEFGASKQHGMTAARFEPFLRFLRSRGVTLPDGCPRPLDRLDGLMGRYREWMKTQRGLADRTMGRYEKTARRFLVQRLGTSAELNEAVASLTAESVTDFLQAEIARGQSTGSMQGRVAEMRSLLRFCYVTGLTSSRLAQAIPAVPGWKGAAVPPRMPAEKIRMLLDSCDADTAMGIRDFAMLMLLARLGLRAAEVARLELDDLHWRDGELVVRGKARRTDRMPLLDDVGGAVARYLRRGRPGTATRVVFMTVVAPHRPLRPTAVSQTVWRQCRKAGVEPVRAHALRHALATEMLDHGVHLPEIGQLLRQADLATTAGYAKVNYSALRELAPEWTGATR